jgi:hypothetical protein
LDPLGDPDRLCEGYVDGGGSGTVGMGGVEQGQRRESLGGRGGEVVEGGEEETLSMGKVSRFTFSSLRISGIFVRGCFYNTRRLQGCNTYFASFYILCFVSMGFCVDGYTLAVGRHRIRSVYVITLIGETGDGHKEAGPEAQENSGRAIWREAEEGS